MCKVPPPAIQPDSIPPIPEHVPRVFLFCFLNLQCVKSVHRHAAAENRSAVHWQGKTPGQDSPTNVSRRRGVGFALSLRNWVIFASRIMRSTGYSRVSRNPRTLSQLQSSRTWLVAGVHFGHGRRFAVRFPGAFQPSGPVREQPRRLDTRRHVRQFELNRLKLADRPAELLPLFGIRHRVSSAPWAIPTACAAMPVRPPSSVIIAILKPCPSWRRYLPVCGNFQTEIIPSGRNECPVSSLFCRSEIHACPFRR